MTRSFWFFAGAGASVWGMVKGRRMAEVLTPEGANDRWRALQAGWQTFADEVRLGRVAKERELRERVLMLPSERLAPRSLPAGGRHEASTARSAAGQTDHPNPDVPGHHGQEDDPAEKDMSSPDGHR